MIHTSVKNVNLCIFTDLWIIMDHVLGHFANQCWSEIARFYCDEQKINDDILLRNTGVQASMQFFRLGASVSWLSKL